MTKYEVMALRLKSIEVYVLLDTCKAGPVILDLCHESLNIVFNAIEEATGAG